MKYRDDLSYEIVSSILEYDPVTGKMFWKPRTPDMFEGINRSPNHCCSIWNANNAGKEITYKNNQGYILAAIFGKRYMVSRLAWLLIFAEWPSDEVDHVNGDKADNRISNLRLANRSQNNFNKHRPAHNTSGFKGVNFDKSKKRWRSRIVANRKEIYLGYFDSPEDAYVAYKMAAIKYHGEYANIE